VVIPVVKGDFAASFRRREKPANRGAARLSGIGAGRGSDTVAALPKTNRVSITLLPDNRYHIIPRHKRKEGQPQAAQAEQMSPPNRCAAMT